MELFPKFIILVPVKQSGKIRFTGTFPFEHLTLYRMNGQFYARKKSRLTGKRFQNDAAFEGSRRSSDRFKRGNELASQVYQSLPEEQRVYKLFCRLKREAILWLKQGKTEEEVVQELEMICANPEIPTCHLNLSLPLTVLPVAYHDWYKQEEKAYEYNYENQQPIERKQALAYIEGSENVPLNLSLQDIWRLTQGDENDIQFVVDRLHERLGAKQRKLKAKNGTMLKAVAPVVASKQRPLRERSSASKKSLFILLATSYPVVGCRRSFNSRRRSRRHALFRQ